MVHVTANLSDKSFCKDDVIFITLSVILIKIYFNSLILLHTYNHY